MLNALNGFFLSFVIQCWSNTELLVSIEKRLFITVWAKDWVADEVPEHSSKFNMSLKAETVLGRMFITSYILYVNLILKKKVIKSLIMS